MKRFWDKVRKGRGCWEWQASRSADGYGRFRLRGKLEQAHRIAWELAKGTASKQMVLHKCDNPPCVRVSHLFEGTHLINARDRARKGRSARLTGDLNGARKKPETRARGERHGCAKLSAAQVVQIRKGRVEGATYLSLAKDFGVSKAHARRIALGLKWRA